jgi:GNAT superfamily N-acetyltransferase
VTNLAQLTHDQISKDLQTDLDGRRALYARLFPRLHEYDSLWDISWLLGQYLVSDESMISCVPRGFRPHTDLTRQFVSLDTRSREMRNKTKSDPDTTSWLVVRAYRSSVGIECFMSVEDELGYLYGFTRLLLPDLGHTRDREWLWAQTALIRELHVYGNLQSLSSLAWAADPNPREQSKQQVDQKAEQVQHTWIGSLLMSAAEQISRDWWYTRLSVISGIWVRKYYERLGYQLEGTYMLKTVGGTKQ